MKKILLFIAIASAAFSCSDDDSSKNPASEPVSLPSKITIHNEIDVKTVYNLTYDAKRRIQNLTRSSDGVNVDAELIYSYNDKDMIEGCDFVMGNTTMRLTFGYNNSDMLQSLQLEDETFPIAYSSVTQLYTGASVAIKLNDNGDLSHVNSIDFMHSSDKKGVFNSVVGKNFQLNNLYIDIVGAQQLFLFFGSRSAIENTISAAAESNYDYTTTYDEAGYPSHIEIRSQNALVYDAKIEYTNQ